MIAITRRVNLLVWIVSACACGLLFLLGALSYQATDRELPPGSSATLQIQQVTVTEIAAVSALTQAAQEYGVNLMRVGADPAGPDAGPWYFAFVGDPALFESTFPGGAYPAFSPTASPRIFDGSELGSRDQPIRGFYAVQGETVDSSAIADTLAKSGLIAEATPVDPTRSYLSGLLQSSLWPLLFTAVIGLALSIVYWVASSRKATALQQFHGYTRSRIVFGQTTSLIVVFTSAMATVVVVGSLALVLLNGGNQYSHFLPWALLPMLAVGAVALATQLVASTAALWLPGYAALKGARPRRLLALAAASSQAAMLVLVYVAVAQAVSGAAVLTADTRSFSKWEGEQGSVTVQINPHAFEDQSTGVFEPDVAEAYRSFGSIFAELDNDGSAVLSIHDNNRETGASGAPLESYAPLSGNSMIVNNNYLYRHNITAIDGTPLTELTPGQRVIHLLIPENLADQQEELTTIWANSTLAASDPLSEEETETPFTIVPHLVKVGQEVFNYGDTREMERWVQTAPVVAVVSPESKYISDYILLGIAANNGNVIFTDSDQFRHLADESGLTQRFSGVNSPAAHAAQQLRENGTELIVAVGTAIAGALTLTVTVALLAGIYADVVRFPSFLRRIHGWPAARIHWAFVASVSSASALVILTAMILGRMANLATEPISAAVALFMALLVTGVVTIATLSLDRRARASLIKRR